MHVVIFRHHWNAQTRACNLKTTRGKNITDKENVNTKEKKREKNQGTYKTNRRTKEVDLFRLAL